MIKQILSLLTMAIGFLFFSCEKDDICVEGDTPLLVIAFYDMAAIETLKDVPTLRVVGNGKLLPITTFTDRTALNTVSIPLKTEEDATTFTFTNTSAAAEDGSETGNADVVTFAYDREADFKSRGCGFIITYTNLAVSLENDTDNWIKNIEVVTTTIENQDTTHVKIFH